MVNNGITSRVKGFPLCYESSTANAENVAKIITIKEYIKNNSDFDFAQEIMSYIPIFEDEENE